MTRHAGLTIISTVSIEHSYWIGSSFVAFNTLFIIFVIIFIGSVVVFGLIAFGMIRMFRRNAETLMDRNIRTLQNVRDVAAEAEGRRKVMDVLNGQPAGASAYKCKGCGATVDSTAELSADGRVRCNYCNQWTSLYQ